jgi:type VI secretion system protein ImpL
MILYIGRILIALLICAIIWWIGPLISIGTYVPLASHWIRGILVALVLIWAFYVYLFRFWSWLVNSGRNYKFKKPLPKTVNEIDLVFKNALIAQKRLHQSRANNIFEKFKAKFTKNYINSKPWYLVVGPNNVGKTTMLQNCGMNLQFSERFGLSPTTSVGATTTCNLWMAEDAIWIDTTGDWFQTSSLSQDSLNLWRQLLRIIKSYRKNPKINGVVLCLDIDWIRTSTISERKVQLDAFRARLFEICEEFKLHVPLYISLSGLDKLPGGVQFLYAMDEEIIANGMSIEMPVDYLIEEVASKFELLYNEFEQSLQEYLLLKLNDFNSIEDKSALSQFIESIAQIRINLVNTINNLFPPLTVGYLPDFRGLWLASNLQITFSKTSSVGLNNFSHVTNYSSLYRAPQIKAINDSGSILNRQSKYLFGKFRFFSTHVKVLISVLIIGSVLLWFFFDDNRYIESVKAQFNASKQLSEKAISNATEVNLINASNQMRYVILNSNEAGRYFTPYPEYVFLNSVIKEAYVKQLKSILWPEVQRFVSSQLESQTANNSNEVFDTLKVYLMLSRPEKRDGVFFTSWFYNKFNQVKPANSTEQDWELLKFHLQALFDVSSNIPSMLVDSTLLRSARVKADNIPLPVRVVNRIKSMPLPPQIEDITLIKAAGNNASLMLRRSSEMTATDVAVKGIYTRAGYREFFLSKLLDVSESVLDEDYWVLKDLDRKNIPSVDKIAASQKLTDDTRKIFLVEYGDAWDNFVKDIRVRPISSIVDAALLARQLSDPNAPLGQLVKFIGRETTLISTYAGDGDSWIDRTKLSFENKKRDIIGELDGERPRFRLRPENLVEDRFDSIRRLGVQLVTSSSAGSDPLARQFEEIYNQLNMVNIAIRGGQILPNTSQFIRMRADAARQPAPISQIMTELIGVGANQSLQSSRSQLSQVTSAVSQGACQKAISGKYPFNRQSRVDIGLDDFNRIFSRNGSLQSHFDKHLAEYVNISTRPWSILGKSDTGQGIVSAQSVYSFEAASRIRELFMPNGDRLQQSFMVRPVDMDASIMEAVLDIDGQTIRYSHGVPQVMKVDWPGPRGGSHARLTLRMLSGQVEGVSFDGPWALFRMYDAASPKSISADRKLLNFNIPGGAFSLELQSTSAESALWSNTISKFNCPNF